MIYEDILVFKGLKVSPMLQMWNSPVACNVVRLFSLRFFPPSFLVLSFGRLVFGNEPGTREARRDFRARNRKLARSAVVIAACYTILQFPDAFQLFLNTWSLRPRTAFSVREICKIFISRTRCTKPVLWTTITTPKKWVIFWAVLFLTHAIPLRNGSWWS